MEHSEESHFDPESTKRLFVGNLDYRTSWQDLKDHFRVCGSVSFANVFRNGCGIVEFEKAEEGLRAINELNDSVLDGRPIFVREDRRPRGSNSGEGRQERPERGERFDRGGRGRGRGGFERRPFERSNFESSDSSVTGRQIFVGNLPFTTTWQDLKDKFRVCGNVIRADIFRGRDGRSKGNGIVLFEKPEEAEAAIAQFNDSDFGGREIQVHLDKKL